MTSGIDQTNHPAKLEIVAHRGASAYAPENTLASLKEAKERGICSAEIDVRLSEDGVVFLFHDEDLGRCSNGQGLAESKSMAELAALDAGGWKAEKYRGEAIVSLEEVLRNYGNDLKIFVEIKSGLGIENKILELLKRYAIARDQVVIMAFDLQRVAAIKKMEPQYRAFALHDLSKGGYPPTMIEDALALGADGLGLQWAGIDENIISRAHVAGLQVYAWTVNDMDEATALAGMGVDGIISDFPDLVEKAVTRDD